MYVLPPLINFFGKLISVAELIASGYASLVSTAVPPPPGFNAAPLFSPTPREKNFSLLSTRCIEKKKNPINLLFFFFKSTALEFRKSMKRLAASLADMQQISNNNQDHDIHLRSLMIINVFNVESNIVSRKKRNTFHLHVECSFPFSVICFSNESSHFFSFPFSGFFILIRNINE